MSRTRTRNLNVEVLNKYNPDYKHGSFNGNNQQKFLAEIGKMVDKDFVMPTYSGRAFNFSHLEECLEFAILYEEAYGNRQIRDYCASLMTRLKSLGERSEYEFLRNEFKEGACGTTSQEYLKKILGLTSTNDSKLLKKNQIIILNMNRVEDEVIELVSSVLARMVYELLRQAEPRNSFPVHLVLEEAHRYVSDKSSNYSIDARNMYERIAKEGRKYGLILLVASQRPSELSTTVLSQCSNFLIHRIQNPEDLSHIRQMTPFISDAILRRLPSLPKQHALVFGTSINLPTTFRVRDADPLPRSMDARIRELWFHERDRTIEIALDMD